MVTCLDEVQMTCIWSSRCHCHPVISASEKSTMVYLSGTSLPSCAGREAVKCLCVCTHTHTPPFNGLFSRTTWVGRYQKDKPFWILLKQEMTGWQWHQLNYMQIICTLLQTDNHASTSSLHIFTGRMPFL